MDLWHITKTKKRWQSLPDKDFYQSLEAEGAEAYEAISEDRQRGGGAIITANGNMGELAFLYVKYPLLHQPLWLPCRPEFFNEHHPDPNMPEQFDQEDGLFKLPATRHSTSADCCVIAASRLLTSAICSASHRSHISVVMYKPI